MCITSLSSRLPPSRDQLPPRAYCPLLYNVRSTGSPHHTASHLWAHHYFGPKMRFKPALRRCAVHCRLRLNAEGRFGVWCAFVVRFGAIGGGGMLRSIVRYYGWARRLPEAFVRR
ncbi:uncharacterized protein YALI1_A18732g [Yarrowia lipolytica]|uniref:Uncharacterized protein n=1 Tax=Yarrowia lipolytica TaxID=4952 RepID=A0A1D8N5B2_YARLL|nr:hypothetical protein YALI1_A18732g [Yarrowia lipolytica]